VEFLTDKFYGTTTTGPTRKEFLFKENADALYSNRNKSLQLFGDLRGIYNCSPYWKVLDLNAGASVYPNGLTITSWYVRCSTADPTTELNADLKYCDSGTTFPGANVNTVATLDSTTGAASATGLTTNVPAAKLLYIQLDADPADYNTTWSIVINFTVL
jgi:hypothetical protein